MIAITSFYLDDFQNMIIGTFFPENLVEKVGKVELLPQQITV